MTELISSIDSNFNFNENTVRVIGFYDNPWFVAKDICDILEIKDVSMAIQKFPDKWKDTKLIGTPGGNQYMRIINEPAIYRLIMRSNKPIALKFQEFVCEDILPTIRKTGEYNLKKQLSEKNTQLQNELRLKEEELELSWITKFNKKSVVYIGFIGIIEDKNYYKFGWTDDIQRRTNDHKKDYDKFDLQYVLECNQNILLEQKLKDHKEIKKIRCSRIFKEKNRTELIVLNNYFTIENVKTILKKLKVSIDENEYISIKHKEKIMELENERLKEQTKQKELDLQILKYNIQSNTETSLNTKVNQEDELKDELEHENLQIEFIEDEIEFVIEEDEDNECILRKCDICNINKNLKIEFSEYGQGRYKLKCKECVNIIKEKEKAKIKYTKIKRVKHFWNKEEEKLLLEGFEKYGKKWAKILKNSPLLIENGRSQVDLKDKYRNILRKK